MAGQSDSTNTEQRVNEQHWSMWWLGVTPLSGRAEQSPDSRAAPLTDISEILGAFIQHKLKAYCVLRSVLDIAQTLPPRKHQTMWSLASKDRGGRASTVTSRTSFRTSTIRNQWRSWGKPSSSALRSCRATFFLQDNCRLKYFTSLLCRDREHKDTSQRHCPGEQRREALISPTNPSQLCMVKTVCTTVRSSLPSEMVPVNLA